MKKLINPIFLTCLLAFTACSNSTPPKEKQHEIKAELLSKAGSIIQASIQAHGAELYETGHYKFTFRGSTYRFKNNKQSYEYDYKGQNKHGDSIHSVLNKKRVQVWKNGLALVLNEKQQLSYSDNLNSVIYFATLPYKLGDQSVNKTYVGTTAIRGKKYEVVQVTFDREGGGTDFDDEFYYWFNSENMQIDYLAYRYQTSGGGVRFRAAYNKQRVNGVLFQDYVNYKAETGIALEELPKLYEMGLLEELSRIALEDIQLIQ